MKCSLKWKPTAPLRKPDKIISSDSRLRGDTMGFLPSYETGPVNMFLLLSNEYQRLWFNEKKVYDKINYAQVQTYLEEAQIRRRYVQRDLRRRIVVKRLPIIKLKQFQDVPSKTDHQRLDNYGKGGKKSKSDTEKEDKGQGGPEKKGGAAGGGGGGEKKKGRSGACPCIC